MLGRERAILVLTSVAFFRANHYNDMLRAIPGLSKRLLPMRLGDLEQAGFTVPAERRRGFVRWEPTAKGTDVVPVLLTMVRFGAKWYGDEPFDDHAPHDLGEIFDKGYIRTPLGIHLPRSPVRPATATRFREPAAPT